MASIRKLLCNVWTALNPPDPSPFYLLKFLAFALAVFAIALIIGHIAG